MNSAQLMRLKYASPVFLKFPKNPQRCRQILVRCRHHAPSVRLHVYDAARMQVYDAVRIQVYDDVPRQVQGAGPMQVIVAKSEQMDGHPGASYRKGQAIALFRHPTLSRCHAWRARHRPDRDLIWFAGLGRARLVSFPIPRKRHGQEHFSLRA